MPRIGKSLEPESRLALLGWREEEWGVMRTQGFLLEPWKWFRRGQRWCLHYIINVPNATQLFTLCYVTCTSI